MNQYQHFVLYWKRKIFLNLSRQYFCHNNVVSSIFTAFHYVFEPSFSWSRTYLDRVPNSIHLSSTLYQSIHQNVCRYHRCFVFWAETGLKSFFSKSCHYTCMDGVTSFCSVQMCATHFRIATNLFILVNIICFEECFSFLLAFLLLNLIASSKGSAFALSEKWIATVSKFTLDAVDKSRSSVYKR